MLDPFLEVRHVTKRFPGVLALCDVSLVVSAGEIVALIGENGAGKSTLMKILGGVHQADAGEILINGRPVALRSVADSISHGIGFVHQELNNLPNLDVAANVYLGREPVWGGPLKLINRGELFRRTVPHLRRLGLYISPATPLGRLSLAQQQMVEIAKALSLSAKLIIMDEPTSSLTLKETNALLHTIADLRGQGVSVIYISHRLGEVNQVADRVVVLRDGRNAGNLDQAQITHENMVRLMVGRDLRNVRDGATTTTARRGGLSVSGLVTPANPRWTLTFEAHRGEILGFAGLVGAGRSEMATALFGTTPALAGAISLDGQPLSIRSPKDAIGAGIYLVPEDRRKAGLLVEMNVRENITLPNLWSVATLGLIRSFAERRSAGISAAALRIKAPTVETKARNLSGGNQQKIVLAKWLARDPKVLIVDEPTRGIDVGAKAEIYRLLRELAEKGVVIIMISSDMEEVLGVSDRLAVMHEGRISGFLDRGEFSEEAVMRLAVGHAAAEVSV
jgi:ribose transport system ATP-binding protein